MAKEIPLDQIANYMDGQIQRLVKTTTLEWEKRAKEATPVDTGRLRGAWQNKVEPYQGEVTNNVKYAEPVCYGTNLPPSWKGEFRTRQGTVAGFPELIGKELESWAQGEYQKIIRRG
tara:strand:- start:5993 stop:6343 length:351 start_codon:yes stop_codon:yes gene_type:complete